MVYIEKRKRYKEYLKEKRKEHREEEEKELRSLRSEKDVWKFINKKRRKKMQMNENNISKEEWRRYFMSLLGGKDLNKEEENYGEKRNQDSYGNRPEDAENEHILEDEEIIEAIRKMK